MRGRLFVQGASTGFYREGTHTLCDAAGTRQLTGEAVDIGVSAAATLHARGTDVLSVTISENIAGDQRAVHAELRPGARADDLVLQEIVREHGLTGLSTRAGMVLRAAGEPVVADPLHVLTSQASAQGALSRHAESFFQANRYLLPSLVAAVLEAVPGLGDVLELYAGVGLFSVGLAATGRTRITAVEGDMASGADLRKNASQFAGALKVVLGSVEEHAATAGRTPATVIVDPPRTGISKAAMQRVLALGASRVVYVSCDPPTMARDARRLLDAGYALDALRAFDLFPNTPHVECLGVFTRDAVSG
jgi:23S rRNA (uracil1939-C5)-methyltransferase